MDQTYRDVVEPFYTNALTVNDSTPAAEVLEKILADDFQSMNGQEVKDKATIIGQVGYFWKLMPDLAWAPQDVVADGDKYVVRSVATGSPRGDFMGLSLDGTKTFTIDTIDIHTVRDGRIVEVYHLEDWATAIKQLKG